MKAKLVALAGVPLLAGCGFAYGAGGGVYYEEGYYEDVHYDHAYTGGAYYDYEYSRHVDYRRLPVPRGYLPAPGRCRVWLPGVSPGRQPRSGSCRALDYRVPRGGWLLVRPYDYPGVVELIVYDHKRPRIKKRYIYDVYDGRRVNRYRR